MAYSDDQNLDQLIEAVSQLYAGVSQLAQVSTANNGKIELLTTALDVVVTEFVRPTAKQAYENQRVIAQLIERSERYQEWGMVNLSQGIASPDSASETDVRLSTSSGSSLTRLNVMSTNR